jgi:hypothetical protein
VILNHPTERQILDARAELYVALVIAQPTDHFLIIEHVLKALTMLGDTPPKGFDLAGHLARRSIMEAGIAAAEVPHE